MLQKSRLLITNQDHFNEIYKMAIENDVLREFISGINYLATYSEGYNKVVDVIIYPDTIINKYTLVADIFKHDSQIAGNKIITIGMVWNYIEKNWSFHS